MRNYNSLIVMPHKRAGTYHHVRDCDHRMDGEINIWAPRKVSILELEEMKKYHVIPADWEMMR